MTKTNAIPTRDLTIALFIVFVWALSFAVLKAALTDTPPFLLAAIRYLVAAVPALFFFRPPKVPLRLYLAFGMTMCFGQFALLFLAMQAGMPSGLASLVMQSHAFFTLVLAAVFLKERWTTNQLVGLLLALGGLVLLGSASDGFMPLPGFLLSIGAAFLWSLGNISSRFVSRYGPINQLAFVIWTSLIPVIPFFILSCIFEGNTTIISTVSRLNWNFVGAVIYMAWGSTLLGYAAWNYLLAKHPVNQIAPFTLLVPLVALTTGWILFDEALKPVHFFGCGLLMIGLTVNMFGDMVVSKLSTIFSDDSL